MRRQTPARDSTFVDKKNQLSVRHASNGLSLGSPVATTSAPPKRLQPVAPVEGAIEGQALSKS
jgi:hypothetical protein